MGLSGFSLTPLGEWAGAAAAAVAGLLTRRVCTQNQIGWETKRIKRMQWKGSGERQCRRKMGKLKKIKSET